MAKNSKLDDITKIINQIDCTRQELVDQLSEMTDLEPEQLNAFLERPIEGAAAKIVELYGITKIKNKAVGIRQELVDQLTAVAGIKPEHLEALLELPIKVASEELPKLERDGFWAERNPISGLQASYGRLGIDPGNDIWRFEETPLFFRSYDNYKNMACHANRTMPDPFIGIGVEGEAMKDEETYKTEMVTVLGEAFAETVAKDLGRSFTYVVCDLTARAFRRMLGMPITDVPTADKKLREFYALNDLYRMHVKLTRGDEGIDEGAEKAAESLENEDPWGIKGSLNLRRIKKTFRAMLDSEMRGRSTKLTMSLEGHIAKAIHRETGCSYVEALDQFFGPVVVKMLYGKDASVLEYLESEGFADYLHEIA